MNGLPELSLTLFHWLNTRFLRLIDALKDEWITKFLANVKFKSFADWWPFQVLLYAWSLIVKLGLAELGSGKLLLRGMALVWEGLGSGWLRDGFGAVGLVWKPVGWLRLLETVVLVWGLVIDGLGANKKLGWPLGLLSVLAGFGGGIGFSYVWWYVSLVDLLGDLDEWLL